MRQKPTTPTDAQRPSTLLCGMNRYCRYVLEMSGSFQRSAYSCPNPLPSTGWSATVKTRFQFSKSRHLVEPSLSESVTDRIIFTGLKAGESEFHPTRQYGTRSGSERIRTRKRL